MSGIISSIGNTVGGVLGSVGNIFSGGSGNTAQTAANLANPVAGQQPQYQQMLQQLMTNPGSITSMPGYQANFNQGLTALQRQEAATGNLSSGTADTAAMQFGQNFESQYFTNYEGMLAQLGGFNSTNPGAAAGAYASAMGNANSAGSGLFGALLGAAGLSAFGGGSSALTGATGDLGLLAA